MRRGRPKKLSGYEQTKAKKIRNILADNGIGKFDKLNDSALLDSVHVDSGGKVFVSYAYHDSCMQGLCRMVNEYTRSS